MGKIAFILESYFTYVDSYGITQKCMPEAWENDYFDNLEDAFFLAEDHFCRCGAFVEEIKTINEKCIKAWKYKTTLQNGVEITKYVSIYKIEIINFKELAKLDV